MKYSSDALPRRTVLVATAAIIAATLITPSARAARGLNGIGLTKTEFAARYGGPLVDRSGSAIYQIGGETFTVSDRGLKSDLVMNLEWGNDPDHQPAPMDVAISRLAQFLPDDAVLTQTIVRGESGLVQQHVYTSPTLAAALAGSAFIDNGEAWMTFMNYPAGTTVWANLSVGPKGVDDR